MTEASRTVGYVLDNATPYSVRFVSRHPPPAGDYVVIEHPEGEVLGLVEAVGTRSIALSTTASVHDPAVISKLLREHGGEDVFFECSARLLGFTDTLRLPRTPPLPGSTVRLAPDELLMKIFGGSEPYKIRIGVLASRPSIPVYVDVNRLVTRHLAILAVTGAGKSNTVAVISDRLTRIGGTVLIFDFHGEYVESTIGEGRINVIEPKLNPSLLTVSELMTLLGIEHHYYNQERVLRKAYEKARELSGDASFLEKLKHAVESLKGREDSRAVAAVVNKIEGLSEKHRDILDEGVGDVVARIRPGYANIVDLSRVDEEAADVVVSHFLRRILMSRKMYKLVGKGLETPLLVVVEEAHILAPKDRQTLSKYWLARIAREGRKFGVGLVLVSQRPKNLDQDTLSQTNNKIILRIVEPSDQKYIQAASETLSDDLTQYLPALNVGEAIVIGPMIPIPALVKIDKFEGRLGGSDPDVVGEWLQIRSRSSSMVNELRELIEDLV